MPVDGRSGVAFESYRERTPLLTIWAARPGLLVTFTLPEHLNAGHVRFARRHRRDPQGIDGPAGHSSTRAALIYQHATRDATRPSRSRSATSPARSA
jgi:hypothetical protein